MPYLTTKLLILAAASASVNVATPLSPNANEFINQGAITALSACDLPKRTCNGKPLKPKSIDLGTTNDQKKSFESYVTDGMKAMLIFNVSTRSNYTIGYVEISNGKWTGFKGVMIGSHRESVVQSLGEPNNGSKNSCDVYSDDAHQAMAEICYRAGIISRIRWEFSEN